MRLVIQYVFWVVGLGLQVLVINALVRGPWRRQPLIFVYCVSLFLTTTLEVATSTMARPGAHALARSWQVYYWIDDTILQTLVFCVVISLIHQATRKTRSGAGMGRRLIAGGVLIWVASFLWHHGPWRDLSAWMTLINRDLSFASVVLDLLLWSTLIALKKKDLELLMLSGGLGIEFTASAIGQSVRQLAERGRHVNLELAGSVLVVLSTLMCLYVWWQAFRRYGHAGAQRPV